jgi:hypothetical protein
VRFNSLKLISYFRIFTVEETKNIKHTLTEARLESETLELEKKQLMQNWNSCLIGIRRRDEAQATMGEAVRFVIISQLYFSHH